MSILDIHVIKELITHITYLMTFSSVYMTMSIQCTPLAKGLTTGITDVRKLSSIYMSMSIQCIPVAKDLTHTLQM